MLEAIRYVGHQEPSVGVGQVVVDRVAIRHRAQRTQRVDVVVSGTYAQLGFEQAGSHEHEGRRNNQFTRLGCDQQATFIRPCSDLNYGGFKRSLVQVGSGGRTVAVGATRDQRVVGSTERFAVAVGVASGEGVVEDRSRFNLLGISHGASQSFGIPSRERIVQVVLDGLFGQRETKCDGLVVVTGGPRFLTIVVHDGRTFVLHRCLTKARKFGFFFERTFGRFGFEDFFMLLAVASVLKAKQGIEAGEQFFKELSA